MLESSRDVLNLVIALCVFLITVFFCWLIYYFAMIIKNARDLIKSAKEKIDLIDSLVSAIKTRVEHSATYLTLLVDGIEKVVSFLQNKNTKNSKSSRSKKK